MKLELIRNNFAENWQNPRWWRQIAVPFAVRNAFVKPYFEHVVDIDGVDVMAEDWDNLVILDACRYDMFEQVNTLPGRLESRISKGSSTTEFLKKNFEGERFDDTVYVTANPQVDVHLDDTFHAVESVWKDRWDDAKKSVPPRAIAEATRRAQETYPNKRLISHWIQPHYPFLGETGQSLSERQAGIELSKRMAVGETPKSDHDHVWDMLKKGTVAEETVRKAYWENLTETLPYVEDLVSELTGKTVITSDHGNLLGERPSPCPVPFRLYGHPEGVHTENLVKVPWFVPEGCEAERRTITAEGSDAESEEPSELASERLRDLGYVK